LDSGLTKQGLNNLILVRNKAWYCLADAGASLESHSMPLAIRALCFVDSSRALGHSFLKGLLIVLHRPTSQPPVKS